MRVILTLLATVAMLCFGSVVADSPIPDYEGLTVTEIFEDYMDLSFADQLMLPVAYSHCPGTSSPQLTLTKGFPDIEPWPIVPGINSDVVIKGKLSAPLEAGAKLTVSITLFGVVLMRRVHDYCNSHGPCPKPIGNFSHTISLPIPEQAISAVYEFKAEAVNADGSNLFCLIFKVPYEN